MAGGLVQAITTFLTGGKDGAVVQVSQANPLPVSVVSGGGGGGGGGAVTQPDPTQLNAQVVGNVASGAADAGNPVKVGGVYNSSTPGYTTGQRGDLAIGSGGQVLIGSRSTAAGSLTFSTMATIQSADGSARPMAAASLGWDGTVLRSVSVDTSGYVNTNATGNVASGATDSGAPVKVGGVFNTTQPTLTTGQRGDIQVTARGEQLVSLSSGAVAIAGRVTNADAVAASTTASALGVFAFQAIYNGTSWDRQRKANVFNRVASSAASGNPAAAKASAGDVKQFWGLNTTAAVVYLQIYNKTTAPTLGTDTPVMTYPIPASAGFSQTLPDGAYLATGIAYAFTTDVAGTTGAAAGAITSFNLLVA